jgi:hypothetical protein
MRVDMIDLSTMQLCWRYSWDPAMMSFDKIDLSCTGSHHVRILEIYLGLCHDEH